MKIQVSNVYDRLMNAVNAGYRVIMMPGGSRSSKTWSIFQALLVLCQQNQGKHWNITISREKMSWIRSSLMVDLKELLIMYPTVPFTPDINANRQHQEYSLYDHDWLFMGLDDTGKLHGRKQHIGWINEANQATRADFDQMEMRTSGFVILDYNPDMSSDHWLTDLAKRPDVCTIHSTQLDNPFLPQSIRNKIMSYEPTPENIARGTADEVNWKIYGLGIQAQQQGIIFTDWQYEPTPHPDEWKWVIYGLDFGFTNDPTALVRVVYSHGNLYLKSLIYDTGLTNSDISEKLHTLQLGNIDIIADSAEPKSIEELSRKGWNIKPATKGPDSVRAGIDLLKQYPLRLDPDDRHLSTEFKRYKWKTDKNGVVQNAPVDAFNHGIDATRYAASHKLTTSDFFVI